MARADLLINLVKAGNRGDQTLFRKTVDALIAEERKKQHNVLADQLAEQMKTNGAPPPVFRTLERPDDRTGNLFFEMTPQRSLNDLILPEVVNAACRELTEEHHRRDLLRSYNLEPRNRILLEGPPGNGKTSLAEALATELMLPLIIARYEAIIGTYLGETSVRLKRLFDYAHTRHCVLFFDEFDTLGKERGDIHETGEIKRVVSSLLLQVDALPSHVIVVTATNHPELLDRAVWRRFQLQLSLPAPSKAQLIEWFSKFASKLEKPFGYEPQALAEKLKGASFAEAEDFGQTVLRRFVLSLPNADMKKIVEHCLQQWQARAKPSYE